MRQPPPVFAFLIRSAVLISLVLNLMPVSGLVPSVAAAPAAVTHSTPAATPAAAPSTCGIGDPGAVAGSCSVTIDVRDFPTGAPLDSYNFIVNVDNTKLPSDPLALSTESNSPIVRTGDQSRNTITLPDGRYLVSARSLDHKMWGAYFTLPNDADNSGNLTVQISLTVQSEENPLPLGKIRVFVFNDNAWTNGAPDTEEGGLGGFRVGLEEQTQSAVTVDYFNHPLCTLYQHDPDGNFALDGDGHPIAIPSPNAGNCSTSGNAADTGFVEIDNLGPASYFINVQPPESCDPNNPSATSGSGHWYQTTTIDGGVDLFAPTEEGADGTGAPGEQLWEPPNFRTAYWFGFVCSPRPFANSGTGEIVGQARNWVEWAPYTTGTWGDPVENPFVALSDSSTDQTVYVGQGDGNGNFDIQGVPAGDYNLAIWDEQLSYIMRFKPVHVNAGATVDVDDLDDAGNVGVGVSRWFGWLDGYVYKDVNNNGQYDPGTDPTIPNTDMDQRWRDGSIKEGTFTDASGHYEYPTAEGGALGRWIVNEQGFARFSAFPGASMYDEHTGAVIPSCAVEPPAVPPSPCLPNAEGGGLLMNQLLLEGHRATVDWGKRDYAPGTPGQIVGITYFATTRNEFEAYKQAHEDYEPAIPDVTVYLETPGTDGVPNTADDVVVNKYITDHWVQPSASEDPLDPNNSFTQNCNPIRDFSGADVTNLFNPDIGPNCLEVPLAGQQTKEGKFDGGYAFADYCPNGYDMAADDGTCVGGGDPVSLVAGNYIVHVIMPKDPTDTRDCNPANPDGLKNISDAQGTIPGGGQGCIYRVVREEDVNVDLGNHYSPQIPPPPCNGDMHVIDQSTLTPRSIYYTGDQSTSPSEPLCDKHLVVLNNTQNANADFNMMTNFRTDPNGTDASDTRTGDVAEPGRIIGQVFNDIYFERNQMSNWYGEPRPIANIPIGIYARVDTTFANGDPAGNVNAPYDPNQWRLIKTITTSPDGAYEILLPSSETWNCPIPQGPCPGMYLVTVNDPGTKEHPNSNYAPDLLVATTPAEVWPGLTDQLDTPIDPISGTACEDPAGGTTPDPSDPARPDLLQVDRPYVNASDSGTARRITIFSDFIGTGAGTVKLTDWRTGAVTNLTTGNGGIVSWTPGSGSTPDTIVIQVPNVSGSFLPGPKNLSIITASANGAVPSVNGITLHVLYASTVTPSTRVDTGATINTGIRVYDPSLSAVDTIVLAGASVSGAGIPAGTTISSVTFSPTAANRYFTMNNAATATATGVPLTLSTSRTDPNGTRTAGSLVVSDPSISFIDAFPAASGGLVGRSVTGTGIPAGATVASVNFTFNPATRTFTLNAGHQATSSGTSPVTFSFSRVDANTSTNNGTLVLDSAITAADVGSTVAASAPGGIPAGATIVSVNPGVSFVMSVAATQTGTRDLTISSTAAVVPYNPTVVTVAPPPPLGAGSIQAAIDSASPGDLIVLSPGTYNENVLVWKPVKLQGLGPGGIIGAHELQGRDPEDPRFNIPGSVIDGRFFQQNAGAFDATVSAHAPYVLPNFTSGSPSVVLRGADLTLVAQSTSAFDVAPVTGDSVAFGGARLDGLGLMTGRGDGAGGVQLQASINNLQITNNVLENNGGVFAGGIGLGQPFVHESHNYDVRVANDRLIGNGGLTTSGGLGIFYGSNNYEVASSIVCSNFSVEYGAGISHIGLSPNGNIRDSKIYYNESVDSGGGIAIESELPVGGATLGDGSGPVNVDRNLIQSNISTLDDGGGIFVLDALTAAINIRNNMIVDNVAADLGGAIMLDDASNVSIINNTIANNDTTGSSESSLIGVPHGAGLTSEANDPLFQAVLGAARTDTVGTRTTGGSTTVLDPAITAADIGKNVSGNRIQARTRILSVAPGVSFNMGLPATGFGNRNNVALTIAPPDFSNPIALFNNIFWNNDAYTLDSFGPGATLIDNGYIDFEVHGTANTNDTFTPRFSDLTNNIILGPDGVQRLVPPGQGNTSGDPGFVTPFINELAVSGSRLDPQQAAISITGQDPPVGLTGDYHLIAPVGNAANLASLVVDRGVRCSNTPFPVPASSLNQCASGGIQAPAGIPGDHDSQYRPQRRVPAGNLRARMPWDLGADELSGTVVALAGVNSFGSVAPVDFNVSTIFLPLISK